MLREPTVLMTNIATLLVGFGMFGSFILIPQLVESPESTGYGFGLDATGAGLLMVPGALVMLVAGPLSGVLGTRCGSRVPLALGAIITSVGLTLMALDARHPGRDGRLEPRDVDRHRARVRGDAEPDRRGGAAPRRPARRPASTRSCARSAPRWARRSAPPCWPAASSPAACPTDSGYTAAFLVGAGVAFLAAITAFLDPRAAAAASPRVPAHARHDRRRRAHPRRRRAATASASSRRPRGVRREGRGGASVPEIAARAGVGKGTVYRCFPTKDHLVAAVASERVRWFEREARAAARRRRPLGRVRHVHGAHRRRPLRATAGWSPRCRSRSSCPSWSRRAPPRTTRCGELMDRAVAQGAMRADAEPRRLEGPAQRHRPLARRRPGARSRGLAALRAVRRGRAARR